MCADDRRRIRSQLEDMRRGARHKGHVICIRMHRRGKQRSVCMSVFKTKTLSMRVMNRELTSCVG